MCVKCSDRRALKRIRKSIAYSILDVNIELKRKRENRLWSIRNGIEDKKT